MDEKLIIPLLILIVLSGLCGAGIMDYINSNNPEIKIVEKIVEIESHTSCPDVIACTPCIEEPIFDKCELESFAYEATSNNKDIYGREWLRKGDIYFINDKYFGGGNDFCVNYNTGSDYYGGRCYDGSFIIEHPELFKPIK